MRIIEKIKNIKKYYLALIILLIFIFVILISFIINNIFSKQEKFNITDQNISSDIKKSNEKRGMANTKDGKKSDQEENEILPTIKKEEEKAEEIKKEKKRYFGDAVTDTDKNKLEKEMEMLIKEKNNNNKNSEQNQYQSMGAKKQEHWQQRYDTNQVQNISGMKINSGNNNNDGNNRLKSGGGQNSPANNNVEEEMNNRQKLALNVFNYYLNYQYKHGKLFEQGDNGGGKDNKISNNNNNENENLENENKIISKEKENYIDFIKKWKFYRAVIETTTSNAQKDIIINAIITDGEAKGIRLVGSGELNATMDRIIVNFNKMIINNKTYEINGRGYSIDKSEGLVSYIKRHDIQSAVINISAALTKGLSEASRRDYNEMIILPNGQVIESKRMAKNRTREAFYGALTEGSNATEKIIKENQKLYPPIEVVVQRGTKILVRIEE